MTKKTIKIAALFVLLGIQLRAQHLTDTLLHPRNVLIENFTGVKNGNCPNAMWQMDQVKSGNLPGTVSLLNIHTGFYAIPNTTYTTDFRTPFGTQEDTYFGADLAGLPQGLVNRETYNSSQLQPGSNYAMISGLITNAGNSPVNIGAQASYNTGTGVLTVNTELYFTANLNGGMLNVVLAEDSVYANQNDYSQTPNLQWYCQNHILRYCLTNQWDGTLVPVSSTTQQTYYQQSFNWNVSSGINMYNSYVIVYFSDTTSKRTIYTAQTFPINFTNGIQDKTAQSPEIFPNPTNGFITVSLPIASMQLEIINLLGEKIKSGNLTGQTEKQELDLRNCEPGIYFITIKTSEGIVTRKIIKN